MTNFKCHVGLIYEEIEDFLCAKVTVIHIYIFHAQVSEFRGAQFGTVTKVIIKNTIDWIEIKVIYLRNLGFIRDLVSLTKDLLKMVGFCFDLLLISSVEENMWPINESKKVSVSSTR